MKNLFITLFVSLCLLTTNSFASFPVEKNEVVLKQTEISSEKNDEILTSKVNNKKAPSSSVEETGSITGNDDFIITLLLFFFLGGFAAHRWYTGKPVGANILFILTAGGCGIWALIDLIKILTGRF